MRHRVILTLALLAAFTLSLAAESAPSPDQRPEQLVLSEDSSAASQTCQPQEGAIAMGDGMVLLNLPLGAPMPDPAQVSICNCTFAGTCATCSPPPCIRCLWPQTCQSRPCLSTLGSCKNAVCG